jgi:hypothetical protein
MKADCTSKETAGDYSERHSVDTDMILWSYLGYTCAKLPR